MFNNSDPFSVLPSRSHNATKRNVKKVAILCASFNPLTNAHLAMCQAAIEAGFDEVALTLSLKNADKKVTGMPLENRVQAMQALLSDTQGVDDDSSDIIPHLRIAVCQCALFVDTAREATKYYAQIDDDIEICFLMGADTLIRFIDSKYYSVPVESALQEFFQSCRVLAFARGGSTCDDMRASIDPHFPFSSEIQHVNLRENEFLNVSSTLVRDVLSQLTPHWQGKVVLEESTVTSLENQLAQCLPVPIIMYLKKHDFYSE